MKYQPGESLENWSNRVKMYEQGYALQRIAKGEDVELVMSDMARRVIEKMMYPIVKTIKDASIEDNSDKPTNHHGSTPSGVADHVVDE